MQPPRRAQSQGDDAVITFQVDYGVGPQTIELNLGKFQTTEGATQFAGQTIDVRRFTQDGVPQGIFKDLNIRDNGDVELQLRQRPQPRLLQDPDRPVL